MGYPMGKIRQALEACTRRRPPTERRERLALRATALSENRPASHQKSTWADSTKVRPEAVPT
ncbi:hypothetical protein PMI40_03326 [Herbaspirillum sp. YR522]|nr:hypothetical protein PMI40_03326 [Herbaspirillum sp. YR522]